LGCKSKEIPGIDSPININEIELQVISAIKQNKIGEEFGMNVPGGMGLENGYWMITEISVSNLHDMDQLKSLSTEVFLVDFKGFKEDAFVTKLDSDEADFPNAHLYWIFSVFNIPNESTTFDLLFPDGKTISLDALLSP
ncbi:MAG: hypothetical protein MIO92_00405, partial [Methanosarcinaceae archaeon]|nr:hypothetical protein [Methanosarcinaceae archaeon]